MRRQVFERDGWRCVRCGGASRLECDHIIAQDKGGSAYELDNLQSLCRLCHFEKTREERGVLPNPEREAWRELLARSFC